MINIIVIEDQALVRVAVCALLNLEDNIEVIAEVENGQAAIDLIAEHSPDIVLTDIEMPLMNGIELIETMAKNHPQIKTMIMTTFSKAGYIKRALNAGVGAFI